MRVCKTKDGKFLEAQSDATEGTLVANAVGGGYEAKNLVESVISDADFNKLMQDLADQSLTYADRRKSEYPSIPDQLDYIYHNGIEKWKTDMVLPVKNKYPKP